MTLPSETLQRLTDVCIEITTVIEPASRNQAAKTILVSVGMATSDGRRFLAVNDTIPFELCYGQLPRATWNALPLLEDPICIDRSDPDVLPMEEIKAAFEEFIAQIDRPQFWSAEGNADQRTLVDVFGYVSEAALPDGFPLWVSSVREHRARVLDRIGHRDQERLHNLQASGIGTSWPVGPVVRDGFKNAHRLLRILESTEELAKENDVDTTICEPAWGDWRHVWASGEATYRAPRAGTSPGAPA